MVSSHVENSFAGIYLMLSVGTERYLGLDYSMDHPSDLVDPIPIWLL
jgi:hypothetical protein